MEYGAAWFESAFKSAPDAVAASDLDGSVSALEIGLRGRSLAAELRPESPKVVGLDLPAGVDWIVAAHGAWLSGAAVLPLDLGLDSFERERRLGRCDLVLDSSKLEAVGRDGGKGCSAPSPHSPAALLYTSGTSSQPTEVMLSHGNLIAQGTLSSRALGASREDRWLSALPLNHTGGLTVVARSAVWGSQCVLRPKFEIDDFAGLLSSRDANISIVSLVPTMLLRLLDAGLSNPPTLRRAVVSGAPLTTELKLRALDAGIPVVEAWGMTETTGMAAVEREPGQGGAGPALEGIHIELSDEGEIRVGGPTVAPGVMVGSMFNTGDLGTLDGGVLRVTGRASSLIISGGQNVSPERVEDVLSGHPAVEACRVFGIDSSEWGQSVAAEVVMSGEASDAELRQHCANRLAVWETPRSFVRVAELELTSSGKPTRHSKETS